jgi:hypothetical protein
MSEIYNYSPEFVSSDELLTLADFYTQQITVIDEKLESPHLAAADRKTLRKEKFRLMSRRYYLRICHRARATGRY